ncbi:MAG: amidohydrolase family protein [Candidatus Thorarchaeota archaeon]
MRVIDSHVHTWTRHILSQRDIDARILSAKRSGVEPVLDSPASALLHAMKCAGVERAVILPIDSGLTQDMPLTLSEKTDWHVSEIEGHPELITFVGIDPRRGGEGIRELRRAVTERGCRGLKLYPPNGFYPDDEKFYPYYELATELGIPVVIHQGFTSRFKYVKYARPVFVDKVATDFPELRIVIAHVGIPWHEEALMVAAKNPNVYVDLSGWQIYAAGAPNRLFQMLLEAAITRVFPNRVLWGSDYPLFEHVLPLPEWVSFFVNLRVPEYLVESVGRRIRSGDIESIMWRNSSELFFGES